MALKSWEMSGSSKRILCNRRCHGWRILSNHLILPVPDSLLVFLMVVLLGGQLWLKVEPEDTRDSFSCACHVVQRLLVFSSTPMIFCSAKCTKAAHPPRQTDSGQPPQIQTAVSVNTSLCVRTALAVIFDDSVRKERAHTSLIHLHLQLHITA
jgi:hypothetical protein